jgi:fermentation-respiration switch protein FrsA (DUF1100 family)
LPFKNKIIPIAANLYGLKINEVSPLNTARKINKKPILLIHSRNDKFIPYTNSEEIFKSMKNSPNTVL